MHTQNTSNNQNQNQPWRGHQAFVLGQVAQLHEGQQSFTVCVGRVKVHCDLEDGRRVSSDKNSLVVGNDRPSCPKKGHMIAIVLQENSEGRLEAMLWTTFDDYNKAMYEIASRNLVRASVQVKRIRENRAPASAPAARPAVSDEFNLEAAIRKEEAIAAKGGKALPPRVESRLVPSARAKEGVKAQAKV
ncbi:MAG TPA: hypothetical protein VFT82_00490 [Candidatus Paceibacterota bacterium]|nr:hypothetical protein [Candidatus Paceibacterota bacterium]